MLDHDLFQLVKNLDSNKQQQLKDLNLGKGGHALTHINDAISNNCEYTKVYMIYNNETLIGWSLLVPCFTNGLLDRYGINFFVKDEYRKLGLGSHLFKVTNKYLSETYQKGFVAIWSIASAIFYGKNKSDLIEIIISPNYNKEN